MSEFKPNPNRVRGNYSQNDRGPNWRPNIEYFSSLSADGRFLICKTVITAIKPVGYFEKILQGKAPKSAPEKAPSQTEPPETGGE